MAGQSIESMIAEALAELERGPRDGGGKRRIAHASAIIDQYAALCREDAPPEPDAGTEVALPIARSREAAAPAPRRPVSSVAQRVLSRVKPPRK